MPLTRAHIPNLQKSIANFWRILAVLVSIYGIYSTAMTIATEQNSNKLPTEYAILALYPLMGLAIIFLRNPFRWLVFFLIPFFVIAPMEKSLPLMPTPLMLAVAHNDTQMVNAVLENGLGRDKKYRALLEAIKDNHLGIARILRDKGADIRQTNSWGEPLLNQLIGKKTLISSLKFALDNGADVNAANVYGETALMKAVEIKRPDIVRLLLERHADKSLVNKKGETALSLAEKHHRKELIDILKAAK
jgi:hypothetical protein